MEQTKDKYKNHLIIPIILFFVVLYLCYYIISLSLSLSEKRSRFERIYNNTKAYYMARSAMDQAILKLETMNHYQDDSLFASENLPENEKRLLYLRFMEDIIIPPGSTDNKEKYEYRINDLKLMFNDSNVSSLTIELRAIGNYGSYGGFKSSIKRFININL